MPWPFNILAPITLGRRGLQGNPGTPAPANTWDNLTGKPATFTPATHAHAVGDITSLQATLDGKPGLPVGPYDNDHIAKGCAYATHGRLTIVRTTAGPNVDDHTINLQEAVSPNFNPRIEVLGPFGDFIVAFYAAGSTLGDVIDLFSTDGPSAGLAAYCPEWLYLQEASEFGPLLFENGSATAYVSVGGLYYTADGSVKRRMA